MKDVGILGRRLMIGSLNRFIVPDMKKQLTLVVVVFGFGIYVSVGRMNVRRHHWEADTAETCERMKKAMRRVLPALCS